MTLLSNHFYSGFYYYLFIYLFFCANYCVIVTINFSRCCGWLRFAAQPKLLFFYSGHPDVGTAIIIIIIIMETLFLYMYLNNYKNNNNNTNYN